MSLISSFFGSEIKADPPPALTSILPDQAANKIKKGVLPVLQLDGKLILASGEVCHFVDIAAIVTEKIIRQSSHRGDSFHIWKGYTAHTGNTVSTPISLPQYTKGILYITNQRIVFTATKFGFDQKISKLTSITAYSDAISLQFGSKTYNMFMPDTGLAKAALDLII